MEDRLDEAQKIIADMSKDLDMSRIEEMIKDNCISFTYDKKEYRVHLLDRAEKEELDILRREKFGQLIQNKNILLEKDLIKQYKERGLDIDEIDSDMKKLSAEELGTQIKLGESIANNEGDTILKTYKDQIIDIRAQKQIKSAQKTLLLEFSLENMLLNYVAELITYLSLDIQNEDKTWKRMFATLEEFKAHKDEKLIATAGQYSMFLQYI